jgi:hypothetical protein
VKLTAQINWEHVARGMQAAPKEMAAGLKDGAQRAMLGFRKDWLAQASGRAAIKGGKRGIKSTRNWPVEVTGSKVDDIQAAMFTTSQAAHLLEHGGTIRPKSGGKYLALPLPGALGKSGQRLPGFGSPATARRKRGKDFLVVRTKKGDLALRELRGKKKRPGKYMFLLKRTVTVKARLGLYQAWGSEPAQAAVSRRLNGNIAKALRGIFGPQAVKP